MRTGLNHLLCNAFPILVEKLRRERTPSCTICIIFFFSLTARRYAQELRALAQNENQQLRQSICEISSRDVYHEIIKELNSFVYGLKTSYTLGCKSILMFGRKSSTDSQAATYVEEVLETCMQPISHIFHPFHRSGESPYSLLSHTRDYTVGVGMAKPLECMIKGFSCTPRLLHSSYWFYQPHVTESWCSPCSKTTFSTRWLLPNRSRSHQYLWFLLTALIRHQHLPHESRLTTKVLKRSILQSQCGVSRHLSENEFSTLVLCRYLFENMMGLLSPHDRLFCEKVATTSLASIQSLHTTTFTGSVVQVRMSWYTRNKLYLTQRLAWLRVCRW